MPLQYLEQSACKTSGNMLCDYDSLELNTKSGEILTVQFELNDWYRVTRTNAEVGWVPVVTVKNSIENFRADKKLYKSNSF